jgi:hypothetical protein
MVQVDDQVVLEPEGVGQPHTRVTTGTHGLVLHLPRDNGKESSFIPSVGALPVIGRESEDQHENR